VLQPGRVRPLRKNPNGDLTRHGITTVVLTIPTNLSCLYGYDGDRAAASSGLLGACLALNEWAVRMRPTAKLALVQPTQATPTFKESRADTPSLPIIHATSGAQYASWSVITGTTKTGASRNMAWYGTLAYEECLLHFSSVVELVWSNHRRPPRRSQSRSRPPLQQFSFKVSVIVDGTAQTGSAKAA
jgi:hypothetical protein